MSLAAVRELREARSPAGPAVTNSVSPHWPCTDHTQIDPFGAAPLALPQAATGARNGGDARARIRTHLPGVVAAVMSWPRAELKTRLARTMGSLPHCIPHPGRLGARICSEADVMHLLEDLVLFRGSPRLVYLTVRSPAARSRSSPCIMTSAVTGSS